MKEPRHREQSLAVLSHLGAWGFPPEVRERIGAFAVIWGVFETRLETTIWALRGEKVADQRPSTDRTSVGEWIDALQIRSPNLPLEGQDVLCLAAPAAKDLMHYRHALFHGWLLPFPSMPMFIRNPAFSGENRKRPRGEAHVDENLLDMAIDAAWVLSRVVIEAHGACKDPSHLTKLTSLKLDVQRAGDEAKELRHLAAFAVSEKY